jgi:hypothetical protein
MFEPDWGPAVNVSGEAWDVSILTRDYACEADEDCPNLATLEARSREGAMRLLCDSCFQRWSGIDPETLGL